MAINLTPEKASIFRITHIANVPWILAHGLNCGSSSGCDPNFRIIGNPDLISKRTNHPVPIPPGGVLSDYIPFYFTPHSIMLLNIRSGRNGLTITPQQDIAIIFTSLCTLHEKGIRFVYTDGHAYAIQVKYYDELDDLDKVDWALLRSRNFSRDPDDPDRGTRYQAEALVHDHLPVTAFEGIACYDASRQRQLQATAEGLGSPVTIRVSREWYY